jgi:hypothetical protein
MGNNDAVYVWQNASIALKQKDKIMNKWLQGIGRAKRKAKVTSNETVWEWFTNAR